MTKRKPPRGIAASVAIYSKASDSFLLIKRKWKPDRGKWGFPGGYMEVDREDLYQTAAREVLEETGFVVKKSDLELMGVLSDPERDERGHVVDVGFFIAIESEKQIESETDETFAKWIPVKKAETLEFALGHREFFEKAKSIAKQPAKEFLGTY